jgi:hypothetical protein
VDGADECDPHKRLIKGGGAALTREKIIAEASKTVRLHHRPSQAGAVLGKFPLPVEVIPMARSLVAREILAPHRRPAGVARRRGHRQRQRDPGHPQPVDHRSGRRLERESQPDLPAWSASACSRAATPADVRDRSAASRRPRSFRWGFAFIKTLAMTYSCMA